MHDDSAWFLFKLKNDQRAFELAYNDQRAKNDQRAFQHRAIMPFTAEQKRLYELYYEKAVKLEKGDKLVQIMYAMVKILKEAEMGIPMRIKPGHMGIHPKNRSGKKMLPSTMQKKGRKITNVGFTNDLCGPDRAIAFEVSPKSNEIEDHTIKTTDQSKQFGQYKRGVIRGGSVGCGHLNQFLYAVEDGAESVYKDLCMPDETRLSKNIITKDNAAYLDTIENGLVWFLIKAEVEEMYPQSPAIIQRALNIEHHVGEGHHIL